MKINQALKIYKEEKDLDWVWDDHFNQWQRPNGNGDFIPVNVHRVLLKPEFWRSLGKVEGWNQDTCCNACVAEENIGHKGGEENCCKYPLCQDWLHKQHKLIDHLANEGTIQSYFEEEL